MNIDNPKISVVITIYNLENFITDCLNSIIEQSFECWEAIVVNDGSTDNSANILDDYAKKDSRIKVFHKKNGGANSARNLGLDVAKGDYITFVDGDDIIADYTLEHFYNLAVSNDLDCVVGNQYLIKTKNDIPENIYEDSAQIDTKYKKVFTWQELEDKDFWHQIWFTTIPGRLDRRSLYDGIRFNEHIRMGEDQITIKEILLKTKRLLVTDKYTYFYVYRSNSLTHKRHVRAFDIYKSFDEMKKLLIKYNLYGEKYTSFIQYYHWCVWIHMITYLPLIYFPAFLYKFYFFNKNIEITKLDKSKMDFSIYCRIKKYRSLSYFLTKAPALAFKEYFYTMNKKRKKIKSEEISVIVQGAIDKNHTPKCLKSIRKYLPKAEIILSTWEGSDISNLDYDVVLFNKDPGATVDTSKAKAVNNGNRQIISTKYGLLAASRPFTLKLRSDVELKSTNFLKYWNNNPQRLKEYQIFKHKIVCSNYFFKKTIGFKCIMPVPFHLGDWVQFGLKEDLLSLWDIDLAKEPEFSEYFANYKNIGFKRSLFVPHHQFAPEQYVLITACRKNNIDVQMRDGLDYNSENIILSEKIIANNFIIIPPKKWVFLPLKEPYKKWFRTKLPQDIAYNIYTEKKLYSDYKKYILKGE